MSDIDDTAGATPPVEPAVVRMRELMDAAR